MNSIDQTIQVFKDDLNTFESWEDRYSYIISLADGLAPYPEEYRTDNYLVKGCQSRVWLHVDFRDGRLVFDADCDAVIVKGLVGMLMQIFNDRTPEEILKFERDFAEELGLTKHLSANRTNGLASMVKQVKLYAIALNARAVL